jgi:hypothetical protein
MSHLCVSTTLVQVVLLVVPLPHRIVESNSYKEKVFLTFDSGTRSVRVYGNGNDFSLECINNKKNEITKKNTHIENDHFFGLYVFCHYYYYYYIICVLLTVSTLCMELSFFIRSLFLSIKRIHSLKERNHFIIYR